MSNDPDRGEPITGVLRFGAAAVRPLIAHTSAADEHRWPYGWPLCGQCGEVLTDDDGRFTPLNGERCVGGAAHVPAPAAAGLLWHKDEGTYLTSNGSPALLADGERPVVVYAAGYEPGSPDLWNRTQDACGGDDFVELIALDDSLLAALASADARWFVVTVSPTRFSADVECARPRSRGQDRAG